MGVNVHETHGSNVCVFDIELAANCNNSPIRKPAASNFKPKAVHGADATVAAIPS